MGEPLVATYSIAACDLEAGRWGVATQSKFLGVGSIVPWAEPGAGAVATQAYANPAYGPDGLALLRDGLSASEVSVLGDFALITPDTGPGLLPILAGLGAGAVLVAILGFLLLRRRRAIVSAPESAHRAGVPSKRPPRRGRPPGRRR